MSDYISREAFLAEQRHLHCENCARRKGMKNGKMKFVYEIGDAPCRACGIGDVLDDVENFPAADVRPVVKARWEPNVPPRDLRPRCSVCGELQPQKTNFCSNCGADMRGGDAE